MSDLTNTSPISSVSCQSDITVTDIDLGGKTVPGIAVKIPVTGKSKEQA